MQFIVDSGATNTTTFDEKDFILGTLQRFKPGEWPPIQALLGNCWLKAKDKFSFNLLMDVMSVETTFSPSQIVQSAYFHEWDDDSDFIINHEQAMLHLTNPKEGEVHNISIHYNHQTWLPTMWAYRDAFNMVHALTLSNYLTNKHNQNLTAAKKLLLQWHFQLGHAGFKLVQWLGRQGYFGTKGQFMGKARCDACNAEHATLVNNTKHQIQQKQSKTRNRESWRRMFSSLDKLSLAISIKQMFLASQWRTRMGLGQCNHIKVAPYFAMLFWATYMLSIK